VGASVQGSFNARLQMLVNRCGPLRLVQGVLRRRAQPGEVARRERVHEERDTADVVDRILAVNRVRQDPAREGSLGLVIRNKHDTNEPVGYLHPRSPPMLFFYSFALDRTLLLNCGLSAAVADLQAAVNAGSNVVLGGI